MNSVHIQLLKRYVERDESLVVKRITMVLEQDTQSDTMEEQYAKAVITGKAEAPEKDADITAWLPEFKGTMTKEPGLTKLTEFGIDTGENKPIAQRPYNMPLSLRDSVNRELELLLERGYIRESESQWVSPMVTVKKPNGSARICVHFKRINSTTIPLPFYTPRVKSLHGRRDCV